MGAITETNTSLNIQAIVDAVASVLPDRRPIGHHEPYINGKESAYVNECLAGPLSGDIWVKKLEGALASYCGVENAIGVASGTAALHLALMAAGVRADEEVLVPALTFAATANAVRYVGAYPHFIDGPLGINTFKLRQYLAKYTGKAERGRLNPKTGRVISALIVVDLLGFPADLPRLSDLSSAFGLLMIEDASQALGASIGNRKCGSFGEVATFSFNNNKIVTGNGGGCLLTNDPWIAAKATQLATTARKPHPWLVEHDAVGFNYRLQNLNAALALAQFEQLDSFLEAKKTLHFRYKQALIGCEEVDLLGCTVPYIESNHWLVTMMLKPEYAKHRDELLTSLYQAGIHARALFTPLHQLPMFADCPRGDNLMYAEDTFKRAICLPSGVGL